jgi:hypothetical protein
MSDTPAPRRAWSPASRSFVHTLLLVVAFLLALLCCLALGGLFPKWSLETDLALGFGSLAAYYAACLVG